MNKINLLWALVSLWVFVGCDGAPVVTRPDATVADVAADTGPPCVAPLLRCGERCVDPRADRDHCGACGNACRSDFSCQSGQCRIACPMSETPCPVSRADGGVSDAGVEECVDLNSELLNCGACGVRCGFGQLCFRGVCQTSCGAGFTNCMGVCRDLRSDGAHCGACGNACPAGQLCSGGMCTLTCNAGTTQCAGTCRDLATDVNHCGACGNVCPAGNVCSAGACTVTCGAGTTECSGVCRDLASDRNHCGVCGNACPSGTVCSAGRCTVSCGAGLTVCSGVCRDLTSDNAHCGACARPCMAGQVCSRSACTVTCGAGLSNCSGVCRDLSTDRLHCGACGRACASGQACEGGRCVATCGAGQMACAGVCRDTARDRLHCGACGNVCAAGLSCTAGVCALVCPEGLRRCGSVCVSTSTDRLHCGACGASCLAGEVCRAGACSVSCPTAQTNCAGECRSLLTDGAHCGACGVACGAGQVCDAGRCVSSCPTGQALCGGRCLDVTANDANCGGCGVRCRASATCVTGACRSALMFRRPMAVANAGVLVTNYSLVLTIDTASLIARGRMRVDCGDMRFYSDDLGVTLPYFLEGPCNSARTVVLVRADAVPVGASRFWMYYGAPGTSGRSSPSEVFSFYDEFTSLELWDRFGTSAAAIRLETADGRSVVRLGNSPDNSTQWISTRGTFAGDLEIRRMVRRGTDEARDCDDGEAWTSVRNDDPWNGRAFRMFHATGDEAFVPGARDLHGIYLGGAAGFSLEAVGTTRLTPTWDVSVFRRCGTTLSASFRGEDLSTRAPSFGATFLTLFVQDHLGGTGSLVDWVGVRRLSCSDPVTTAGAEEVAP